MAFPNFLNELAGIVPAMAGAQGMGVPDVMGGVNQALGQNQAMGQMQQMQQQHQQMQRPKFGIKNILGMIGEVIAQRQGYPATYSANMKEQEQKWEQQQQGQQIANYLGNTDQALAGIMRSNPVVGMALYRMKNPEVGTDPETIRLMRAAGIDPQSEEGRAIIRGNLTKGGGQSDPTFVRELEALGIDPSSDEARELYYGRNSPAGYLLKPRPRGPVGGPRPGQVVRGFRFKGGNPNDQGSWEPANGGPTPQASGVFPAPRN
jgi:hypothetical protein